MNVTAASPVSSNHMNIRSEQIAKLKEELALHEQTEAAYAAWQKDPAVPLQYKWDFNEWSDMDQQPLSWYPTEGCHYRIKPTPRLRPWSREEARGKWIRNRVDTFQCQIVCFSTIEGNLRAVLYPGYNRSLKQILEDYVQLDGSPCGVQE